MLARRHALTRWWSLNESVAIALNVLAASRDQGDVRSFFGWEDIMTDGIVFARVILAIAAAIFAFAVVQSVDARGVGPGAQTVSATRADGY